MNAKLSLSKRYFIKRVGLFAFFSILFVSYMLVSPGNHNSPFDSADKTIPGRQLITQSGIGGGMVVHLGSGDGTLTMALRAGENYVVQGLECDPVKVESSRKYIQDKGVYGLVSIDHWDGMRLPYAGNLVNLIIAEDIGRIGMDEILRVLAPRGVVMVKKKEGWVKTVKPWPEEIDEWTHYLHGPGNNAVSDDKVVGPPKHMQWVADPMFARSHELNSSLAGMVTAGGRLFYIWDEGPIAVADPRLPQQWTLIARDAFNGARLWSLPMPEWGWSQWHDSSRWDDPNVRGRMLVSLPATLPRRLVASDQRIYITLGYNAPVTVIDAATGKKIKEFGETALADEILLSDNLLVLRVRTTESPPEPDFWNRMTVMPQGRVMVVDAETGRRLWQSIPEEMASLTMASSNGRVYYSNYKEIVCLDLFNGKELWRSEPVESEGSLRTFGGTLVANGEVVLYTPTSGHTLAFSSETGEVLWSGPVNKGLGVDNPPDLFVANDLVWLAETDLESLKPDKEMQYTAAERQGLNPLSGERVCEISVPYLISPGHHYRCYRSKATQNYLLLPKRGVEFLNLKGDNHMRNDWLRATCTYGVLPANGLLYVAPHQCVCYPGVLLPNFNVMASQGSDNINISPIASGLRLIKGPAYGRTAELSETDAEDWPTYRHNARRSGSTKASVTGRLETSWETELGGRLTPPVMAGGRLYVAQKDAHTVHAMNAEDGRKLWHYTVGGRVDSPPTVHGPLVLFGSADGWVYCLWAETGELVWRFLAAPHDRRMAAFGQFESAWPVHGSVLVGYDATITPARPVVYFAAGRSSFLDGGMKVYGLDPFSGEVLHQTGLDGPHPDPFKDLGMAGYMDGAKSDILVSDGADLYLYQNRFRSDLTQIDAPLQNPGPEGGGHRIFPPARERGSEGRHLIVTGGFLDDSFNEGTFWTYSERWPGWDRKMRTVPSFGQLMVFNDHTSFGANYYTETVRVRLAIVPATKGYRMFAREHDADKDAWSVFVPVRTQAMVLSGDQLFFAGPPDVVPDDDPLAAFEGRLGSVLWVVSAKTGENKAAYMLDNPVVFDGMIATPGKLFLSTAIGNVMCLAGK